MKQRAVVWDIDDVLACTSMSFYNAALHTHGSCQHPDDWEDYLWARRVGREEGRDVQSYLVEHRVLENTLPFSYTKTALVTTHQKGYSNILLSARSWHPDPQNITQIWSYDHGLSDYIHHMQFVTFEEPKRLALEVLSETFDICAFVEDSPRNAQSAVGLIPNIYLVNKSWNKASEICPTICRVDSPLIAALHIS